MKQKILIINGPNLNMLGTREPAMYGDQTLEAMEDHIKKEAPSKTILTFFQSNSEGDIINTIHRAKNTSHAIVINPAAYSHTSIAIADALTSVNLPTVEVHLSNIFAREEFRRHSMISPVVLAVISGMGAQGYIAAVNFLKGLN